MKILFHCFQTGILSKGSLKICEYVSHVLLKKKVLYHIWTWLPSLLANGNQLNKCSLFQSQKAIMKYIKTCPGLWRRSCLKMWIQVYLETKVNPWQRYISKFLLNKVSLPNKLYKPSIGLAKFIFQSFSHLVNTLGS